MTEIKSVKAAGGVVYRFQEHELQVLIIFRNGVWDLPKGKIEDETVRECAVREVSEEIGISALPIITQPLTDTYHEYERNGVLYGKTTHWFGMQLTEKNENDFSPQTEEGIEKVEWVALSEAKEMVGYQNLIEVLSSLELLVDK